MTARFFSIKLHRLHVFFNVIVLREKSEKTEMEILNVANSKYYLKLLKAQGCLEKDLPLQDKTCWRGT